MICALGFLLGFTNLSAAAEETKISPQEMAILTEILNEADDDPISQVVIYRESATGKTEETLITDMTIMAAVSPKDRCLSRYEPGNVCEEGALAKKVWCQAPTYSTSNKQVQVDMYVGSAYYDTLFLSCSSSSLSQCARDKLCGSTLPEK
jgi:hypothetical protein